jgi:hypothetical protein
LYEARFVRPHTIAIHKKLGEVRSLSSVRQRVCLDDSDHPLFSKAPRVPYRIEVTESCWFEGNFVMRV